MAYLKNAWYPIAWSDEVRDGIFGRTILEQPVIVFRVRPDRLIALGGRCAHRFAPLARGTLIDNTVACPYHGLRFDEHGACVLNPHGSQRIPPDAQIPSYPVIEKHLLVWVWMGNPDAADPASVPDYNFVDRPDSVTVKGTIFGKGNYELYTDNILDLGHADFIHKTTVGAPSFTYGERKMFQKGNVVFSNFYAPDDFLSPVLSMIFETQGKRVDANVEVQWQAPAAMSLIHRSADVKGFGAEQSLSTFHVFTPQDEGSTYYFWAVSRTHRMHDDELTQAILKGFQATFEFEDKPIIAAQQELMGRSEFWSLKPVLLEGDIAGVRARRVLAKLIAAEQPMTAA